MWPPRITPDIKNGSDDERNTHIVTLTTDHRDSPVREIVKSLKKRGQGSSVCKRIFEADSKIGERKNTEQTRHYST